MSNNTPTGELTPKQLRERIFGKAKERHLNDGKMFELGISEIVGGYISKLSVPDGKKQPRITTGAVNDLLYGTDFIIRDPDAILPNGPLPRLKGNIRVDTTTGMSTKDYVPLITPGTMDGPWNREIKTSTQAGYLQLKGAPGYGLRFGIRTGNDYHGFDRPVVIAALDSTGAAGSDRDMGKIIRGLCDNMTENAQQIIRMSKLTMLSYKYMAEPNVKAQIDAYSRETGHNMRLSMPLLIPNNKYFEAEAENISPSRGMLPHMCSVAVLNEDGTIRLDEKGRPASVKTLTPWMSYAANDAVMVCLCESPYMPDKYRPVAEMLLNLPVRQEDVPAPVILDANMQPITDKQEKTAAMKKLAYELEKMDRREKWLKTDTPDYPGK